MAPGALSILLTPWRRPTWARPGTSRAARPLPLRRRLPGRPGTSKRLLRGGAFLLVQLFEKAMQTALVNGVRRERAVSRA